MADYLETRITKIDRTNTDYKVYVDVYLVGMIADEYEYSGYILYSSIESYDPKSSVSKVIKI